MASANNNTFSYDDSKVPNGKDLRIALIVAQWNKTITDKLYHGCLLYTSPSPRDS